MVTDYGYRLQFQIAINYSLQLQIRPTCYNYMLQLQITDYCYRL